MVVFPNAKINIGLYITEKRPDGFHNLETLFYPIAFNDVLEIIECHNAENDIALHQSGHEITGNTTQNLCVKAYHLLKADFPELPSIDLYLHKIIPMGAGLGGGSSDGAFMLQLLNQKFALGLSQDQLMRYALTLGSDGPFFIYNKPCIAKGRGEILNPIALDLSSFEILIINPSIHLSTAQAFSMIHPQPASFDLRNIVDLTVDEWKNHVHNDFETPVFAQHPEIAEIKSLLYEKGALYASMSGSGSTVYGIFKKEDKPDFNFPESYFYKWV